VSLIELMVALTIGLVLLGGTLAMYMKARDIYSTNDTVARLQENARYAMDLVESDVRMANFWGLMSRSLFITNSACTPSPAVISVTDSCKAETACPGGIKGADWSFDADNYVDGLDGVTAADTLKTATTSLDCKAANDGPTVDGTDVLVVRRASSDLLPPGAAPAANTVYIASTRTSAEIFTDTVPSGYSSLGVASPPRYEVRPFVTSVYYISQDSVGQAGFPALRRKQLGTGPQLTDQEMLPGVEDLQLLFGWDTAGQDQRADVYLSPGTRPTAGSIVAVQVCMVVRSDVLDLALQNATYTDCRGNAVASGNHRRMLISRTVQLRNRRS
jgi:Tfp pilus assembly protein PilW